MAKTKYGKSCGKVVSPAACMVFVFIAFILLMPMTPVPVSYAGGRMHDLRVGISLVGDYLELTFGREYCLFNTGCGDAPLPLTAGRYKLVNAGGKIEVYDLQEGNRECFQGTLFLEPDSSSPTDCSFLLHNALYGREYRGALEIIPEGDQLLAVNVLDLEAYLCGVLPAEMPSLWGSEGGMEALKAQAVAARTFALYNLEAPRHNKYHLCDQQHCQVYKGKDVENRYTDQAIIETRGEILTYHGRPLESFYHASNGGFTELSQNVWLTSSPYLASVPDPYDDPGNPLCLPGFKCYSPWVETVSRQSLCERLAEKGYNIGEVEQINVVSSFPSGRVAEIVLLGKNGRAVSLAKEKAWSVLGLRSQLYTLRRSGAETGLWAVSSKSGVEIKESLSDLEGKRVVNGHHDQLNSVLRGNNLYIRGERTTDTISGTMSSVSDGNLVFEGLGSGHGVGLSQYGAYNRSRAGHSYREILSFYYPGAEIVIY